MSRRAYFFTSTLFPTTPHWLAIVDGCYAQRVLWFNWYDDTHDMGFVIKLFAEMKLPITTTGEGDNSENGNFTMILVNKSKSWTNRDYDQLTTEDDKGTRSASKHTLKMGILYTLWLCRAVVGFEGGISRNTERGAHCTTTTATADDQTYTSRYEFYSQVLKSFTHACLGPMLELDGRMVGWRNVFYEFNWGSLSPQL